MGHKGGPGKSTCMYSSMAKGTSRDKVTSNSKNIKPIALAGIELCWCTLPYSNKRPLNSTTNHKIFNYIHCGPTTKILSTIDKHYVLNNNI